MCCIQGNPPEKPTAKITSTNATAKQSTPASDVYDAHYNLKSVVHTPDPDEKPVPTTVVNKVSSKNDLRHQQSSDG